MRSSSASAKRASCAANSRLSGRPAEPSWRPGSLSPPLPPPPPPLLLPRGGRKLAARVKSLPVWSRPPLCWLQSRPWPSAASQERLLAGQMERQVDGAKHHQRLGCTQIGCKIQFIIPSIVFLACICARWSGSEGRTRAEPSRSQTVLFA